MYSRQHAYSSTYKNNTWCVLCEVKGGLAAERYMPCCRMQLTREAADMTCCLRQPMHRTHAHTHRTGLQSQDGQAISARTGQAQKQQQRKAMPHHDGHALLTACVHYRPYICGRAAAWVELRTVLE